jgi:hypothetical protein
VAVTVTTCTRIRLQQAQLVPLSEVPSAKVLRSIHDTESDKCLQSLKFNHIVIARRLTATQSLEAYIRSEFPPPTATPTGFPPNLFDGISPTPSPEPYQAMTPMEEIPSIRSERSAVRYPLPESFRPGVAAVNPNNLVNNFRPTEVNSDDAPDIWMERMVESWETSPAFLPLPTPRSPSVAVSRRRLSNESSLRSRDHLSMATEESRFLSYREPSNAFPYYRPTIRPPTLVRRKNYREMVQDVFDRRGRASSTRARDSSEPSTSYGTTFASPGNSLAPLPCDYSGSVDHSQEEPAPMVVPGEVVDTWTQVLDEDDEGDEKRESRTSRAVPANPFKGFTWDECAAPWAAIVESEKAKAKNRPIPVHQDDDRRHRRRQNTPSATYPASRRHGVVFTSAPFVDGPLSREFLDAYFPGPRHSNRPQALPAGLMQLVMDRVEFPPLSRQREEEVLLEDDASDAEMIRGPHRQDPKPAAMSPDAIMGQTTERTYLDALMRSERGVSDLFPIFGLF